LDANVSKNDSGEDLSGVSAKAEELLLSLQVDYTAKSEDRPIDATTILTPDHFVELSICSDQRVRCHLESIRFDRDTFTVTSFASDKQFASPCHYEIAYSSVINWQGDSSEITINFQDQSKRMVFSKPLWASSHPNKLPSIAQSLSAHSILFVPNRIDSRPKRDDSDLPPKIDFQWPTPDTDLGINKNTKAARSPLGGRLVSVQRGVPFEYWDKMTRPTFLGLIPRYQIPYLIGLALTASKVYSIGEGKGYGFLFILFGVLQYFLVEEEGRDTRPFNLSFTLVLLVFSLTPVGFAIYGNNPGAATGIVSILTLVLSVVAMSIYLWSSSRRPAARLFFSGIVFSLSWFAAALGFVLISMMPINQYKAGLYLESQGKFQDAKASLSKAIDGKPEGAAYRAARGYFLHRRGEFGAAAKDLEKAYALSSDNPKWESDLLTKSVASYYRAGDALNACRALKAASANSKVKINVQLLDQREADLVSDCIRGS
jgi:hypothetical protein